MGSELNCLRKTLLGVIIVYLIFETVTLVTGSIFIANSIGESVDVHKALYPLGDVKVVINKDSSIAVEFFVGICLTILGGIGICIAILGIVGTCKQNTCLIIAVAVLLLVSAFMQIIFGATAVSSGTVDAHYISKVKISLNELEGSNLESVYISGKHKCCMEFMEDICNNSKTTCAEAIARSTSGKTSVGSGFALFGGIANIGISILAIMFIKAINKSRRCNEC